ncbi:Phage baseplate assembly protein W [Candidatus Sulfopaludibacter sp. SbA3]|nr:Phage baseplate assembly protein W [Candidatus Sulfopaludibacter sp. SbA3]
MTKDFLGTGWNFPVQIEEGRAQTSAYEENIRQSIFLILSTSPGERVMRSDFGCGIHDMVFSLNNATTAGILAFGVREALSRWERRIEVLDVGAVPDQAGSRMLIHIEYRVSATNSRFNLVYPFYLHYKGA